MQYCLYTYTVYIYTGCMVNPGSAVSKASCRSLDDERGAGVLPEEVGILVGITICEKSPEEASVAMTADKY
jgi:hypothetical protein